MTCRQSAPVVVESNCPSIERVSVPSAETLFERGGRLDVGCGIHNLRIPPW